MKFPFAYCIFAFTLVLSAGGAQAQLQSVESDEVQIVCTSPAFSYLRNHIAACAENALEFHKKLYGYTPSEKLAFLVEDFNDYGHGGANSVPTNFVNFGVAPFSYVYDIIPAIDRMYWMANHEVAHIVTMDQAAGRDRFFRKFFAGKVAASAESPVSIYYNYLTSPRWNAPRWYHEGIAVFLETWMAGGLGRVFGGYDEMVFRTMVRDNAFFFDVVGLESEGTTTDFQVGVNSYLYGTRFMSYLAEQYGPDKLIEWTARREGSKAHFSAQFRHVYGTALDEEWAKWIRWERGWQEANLLRIRENPVTKGRPLSATPLGSVSRAFLSPDRKHLYVAIRYPGHLAQIAEITLATGDMRKLCSIKGPALFYVTSLAYDPEGGRLFYTSDNYGWRDLNVVDIASGKSRLLMKDLRVGDIAYNRQDHSLWGIRHFNGISTLVKIPEPYQEWDQVHSWPYGQDIYDLDISPDGQSISAGLARINGSQSLILLSAADLGQEELPVKTVFDFGENSPSNFIFSEDGRYLYGASYYSGVSNIYRYDRELADMSILSNAETGFFRPVPFEADSIIAFDYSGQGFLPVELPNQPLDKVSSINFLGNSIVEKHPQVAGWQVASPADLNFEEHILEEGDYQAVSEIELNSIYPIVEGYRDTVAVGVKMNFADPLNITAADLSASYSTDGSLPSDERLHLAANFRYWEWNVKATYNNADFYDLFGPTKSSRKGYSLGLGYGKTLLYDEPRSLRLEASVTGYGNLDTLPDFQEIGAPSKNLLKGRVGLEYEFVEKSLGAVDEERGTRFGVFSLANYAGSKFFPRFYGHYDYGIPLPLKHSSVWLRGSTGVSFGERDNPFSEFYFGGFGNNWVDHLTEKRYRDYYTFPGADLNEIGGRSFTKLMVEWNLPPVRFRKVGVPSLYLNWMRPAIFSSMLTTDVIGSGHTRNLYNVGGQLDFRIVLFSNLTSTFSIGSAVATEEGHSPRGEFMVSLKLL